MTDDDLAALIAVDWEMDPDDPKAIEAIKSTAHFQLQRLRMELSELGYNVEKSAPRWLRRFVRRWTR